MMSLSTKHTLLRNTVIRYTIFLSDHIIRKLIVSSYSHRYLSVWYLVWPSSI